MSIHGVWQRAFSFFGEKPLVVERSGMQLSSDAGLLVFREFDERIRWTVQFAAALSDRRCDAEHSLLDMVRMRLYGILADYEDQNDHSTFRKDPVFKLIAGRSPDDFDLASQPTLSRSENAVDVASLNRLRDVFIDTFVASFESNRPVKPL